MDKSKVLKLLNQALAMEYATVIRYFTQAAVMSGPYSVTIGNKFKDLAAEELRHTEELRNRIVALGKKPTTDVADIEVGNRLNKMLDINIAEEKDAINIYKQLMKLVPKEESLVLYETIEDILCEEQKDLEELERLME